ncbi:sterol desaturase family protein [Sediminibacterium sp.]|uniref:sterol desaturase family protein n=1 Tax=Sediminibacterium sp. TaxID=1917865 RepID=UPI00272EF337|nr:sterol desaturase family protein [Sediminibacterium sp.]MDP1972822.1 sterol desaturase family protein [Sediminibacterium sp.]MDP2421621.1 sterol desaturase family protein [Sediminibacterium sp.]
MAERVTDLITTGAFYFFFKFIYSNFAIFDIKPSVENWILIFLITDFVWYWYHRFGHKVNIFWSVHVVHHQSDDFNYTVSTRITIFQAIARCIFWSVLPLLGFPPDMIAIFLIIHGVYPFFTHTQLIGKLGWIEYIFVTPSHHRVHHSSNPIYLDKNYGDILIIWDKLFGTFEEEKEEPKYGLTKPLNSYSFLWQHFHFQLEMLLAWNEATNWKSKLKVLFGNPDDIDPKHREILERKLLNKNKALINFSLQRVILANTINTLLFLFITLLFTEYLTTLQQTLLCLFILISIINSGAMLEQKRWVFYLDYMRFVLINLIVYLFLPIELILNTIILLLIIPLVFYKSIQHKYYTYLYNSY